MIRLPRWTIPALAICLLLAIVASGAASQHPASAQAATKQPTRNPAAQPSATSAPFNIPTYTPGPEAATPQQAPLTFAQAPLPDAGTLGIILDRTQNDAFIQTVLPGGPAEKAGLQDGDVVTAVDGKPVADSAALITAVTGKKGGDTIKVTVDRNGKSQVISVTIATRREVYCPLSAPTTTTGKATFTGNPRWSLDTVSSSGVKLSLSGSKMSLRPSDPSQPWQGAATVRLNNPTPTEYIFTMDVTQTNRSTSGILFNYDKSQGSTYLLQLQFNGTWFLEAFNSDGTVSSGPSFTETDWKVPNKSDPSASATNTVSITVQQDNWYLSLNGKFICGLPLSQVVAPPLGKGDVGVFVLADKDPSGKLGATFSKVTLSDLGGASSGTSSAATPGATPATSSGGSSSGASASGGAPPATVEATPAMSSGVSSTLEATAAATAAQ